MRFEFCTMEIHQSKVFGPTDVNSTIAAGSIILLTLIHLLRIICFRRYLYIKEAKKRK